MQQHSLVYGAPRGQNKKPRNARQALATDLASYSSLRGLVVYRGFMCSRVTVPPHAPKEKPKTFCSFKALQPVLYYMGHSKP
jgi:hypothetical protein